MGAMHSCGEVSAHFSFDERQHSSQTWGRRLGRVLKSSVGARAWATKPMNKRTEKGASGGTRRRLFYAVGLGVLSAIGLTELAMQLILAPATYERSFVLDSEGTRVPLSDVIKAVRESAHGEQRVMAMKMCYDRPDWSYFDPGGCVRVDSNSLGLRNEEIGPRSPGEFRALAVGDSFTFGLGVQAEDTWAEQLEALLQARRSEVVEVVNAGLAEGAHEPRMYADWVEKTGLSLDPDLVIVGFCLNDMDRRVAMAKLPERLRDPWLGGHSQILLRLQLRLRRRAFERSQAQDPEARFEREAALVVGDGPWTLRRAGLLRLKALLDERGVRMLVAIFPMMTGLEENYPYYRLHDEVSRFCSAEGIEHLDLLPPLQAFVETLGSYSDADFWVHPTDQHPTPPVHRVFAEGLHAYLSES